MHKIGDLARIFGLTPRTIRYYEELGLIQAENRNGAKHRRYSERAAVSLKRIQQLKDYGLTLSEISELFKLAKADRSGEAVRAQLIAKYRERLDDAKKRKTVLEDYIDDLSWHVEQVEKVKDFFGCPGPACAACPWFKRCDVRLVVKPDDTGRIAQ